MNRINRRNFTKAAVLAPIGAALVKTAAAQTETPAPAAPAPPQSRWTVAETAPFAGEIVFERKPFAPRLEEFEMSEVVLDPGPLAEAREWNRRFLMSVPNDRLLRNFRVNAGLPSSAQPLGGWEDPTCELRGHFVGHSMSALALLYAGTGDSAVKAKGDGLVAGIAECQAKLNNNGYVSAFPEEFFERLDRGERVWAPFYTLHKIMVGLYDMHVQAGNPQALDVLVKLAGWVDGWTASKPEPHMQQILLVEYGGMNEVLYNLAATTGDDRWARVGDRFTKKVFFNPLAVRKDQLKGQHMNTHVPEVIGAARRYEISSDGRFADVAEFFWETVTEARTYATGGSSNKEHWLVDANHLSAEIGASANHQECCCAYNMMKLTRHLHRWTGDARYMDYYERNLLNHRLGTIQPETGFTTYFLSMAPGAWKTLCTEDDTFWCCTGTGVEEYSKLNNTLYFHDREGVYVNLFAPSQLHWKQRGIRLQQATKFPKSDRTVITVEAAPAEEWTLHLRVPAWTSAENAVLLNGERLPVAGTPGSYLAIRRAWKAGDRVEFVMPMRLTAEPLHDDPTLQAFLYGPIVLAGQFPRGEIPAKYQHEQGPELDKASLVEVPALAAKGAQPADWIHPVQGEALHFRTTGQAQDVSLKPFNESWDRFAVYWKVS